MLFERITANPTVATGKPCIRDLRFPVSRLLGLFSFRRVAEIDHDTLHASEIGMSRASDETILATAVEQERVIITADLEFPRLLSNPSASGPGLILLRNGNFSEAESIECVRRVLLAMHHDELLPI